MLVRIVRNLTINEIEERIRRFEREAGISFEKFEELFLGQKLNAKQVRVYFEWAELVDSFRGYVEEGTLDYSVEEIKDFKPEQAALLTAKRIDLLYKLATLRVESINDLAHKVRRDVKNVYLDLRVLNRFGFVRLNRRKVRTVVPETLVKEITFLIR
jgi:ribosomal protein L29